jgi:Xaa-Pro aminopeptidase
LTSLLIYGIVEEKEGVTMLTKQELLGRIERLHAALSGVSSGYTAFIADKVNQYYFTGTFQDGLLVLKSDGSCNFFVRNSYERALSESPLPPNTIHPMKSYKDAADVIGSETGTAVFVETEVMPLAMLGRLSKYFRIENPLPLERYILNLRAVKSPQELGLMRESGRKHAVLLNEVVPSLLREGMSEVELTAALFAEMLHLGYHGVSRFSMFQTQTVIGQIGFGENSLYPTNFDGPGGMKGLCPAVPIIGDPTRTLKKGDLVFVDAGFGIGGYHTDRTQIYCFGAEPSQEITQAHAQCLQVQLALAAQLKPGAIPSELYNNAGFVNRNVRFLGHGVGLYVDEFPVISAGFDAPLQANMTIALEPKRGVEGAGIVGAEDTYVVTENGGECLTGGERGIMSV